MSRLTLEERRRIFLIQPKVPRESLALVSTSAATAKPYVPPRHWVRQVAGTAMIVALLGGGWLAYHAVEFHTPASVVDALLPRQ